MASYVERRYKRGLLLYIQELTPENFKQIATYLLTPEEQQQSLENQQTIIVERLFEQGYRPLAEYSHQDDNQRLVYKYQLVNPGPGQVLAPIRKTAVWIPIRERPLMMGQQTFDEQELARIQQFGDFNEVEYHHLINRLLLNRNNIPPLMDSLTLPNQLRLLERATQQMLKPTEGVDILEGHRYTRLIESIIQSLIQRGVDSSLTTRLQQNYLAGNFDSMLRDLQEYQALI